MRNDNLAVLEEKIGYSFRNRELLENALKHTSFVNERRRGEKSNERLEFLGDSVLSLTVAEYLFSQNDRYPEGEMTKMRANLVCEAALSEYAAKISLGDFLYLGHGEEIGGGRHRPSITSDAFEAVIAAIYLDGGFDTAKKFILRFIEEKLSQNYTEEDYKTIFQEVIQKNPEEKIRYVLVGETGPDHDKRFKVELMLNSNVIASAEGKSKKQAEQLAAKEALELMGE
ncbi:MAG: ribonuclease III [Oscillospiraceae bacterium]|nr:ribonuclease III [Oscillospiraceae bacterium]